MQISNFCIRTSQWKSRLFTTLTSHKYSLGRLQGKQGFILWIVYAWNFYNSSAEL